MKKKSLIVAVLATMCIAVSCSKKDDASTNTPDTTPENKVCTLSGVTFPVGLTPYNSDNFRLTFDSLGRITQNYIPGSSDYRFTYETNKFFCDAYNGGGSGELMFHSTYVLDDNKQLDYCKIEYYVGERISFTDSIDYQYDAEGYLVTRSRYQGTNKIGEYTYTYADGNRVGKKFVSSSEENSWTYTYDTSAFHPVANYLYETVDDEYFQIGKPNKNNVAGIECTFSYGESGEFGDYFKTINYTYNISDNKLTTVSMKGTTYRGANIDSKFGFSYNCK